MRDLVVDACVVGAGPAGSTVARRLASLGHAVCIVERARFPRAHVGESLPPSITPVLEEIGARDRVERAGFLRPTQSIVRWNGEDAILREGGEPGYQVDRGRFDAILLAGAREAGARCLPPARAGAPRATPDGWSLDVRAEDGPHRIAARFLVDATGRRSRLLGRGPRSSRFGPATVALYAYWRGVPLSGTETRVEAGDDAWYWGAPLPDGTFDAAVFVDARACASLGARAREAIYRALLARSALLRGCLDAELASPVRACDASMTAHESPAGPTFARAGEAAFALDPLSSQGVQSAITSGLAAAAVAHTILTSPDRAPLATAFLARRQRELVAAHRRFAATHYASRALTHDTAFWRDRAALPDLPSPPEAPLTSAAPRDGCRLALSRDARIVRAPLLDGDSIVEGDTLDHPSLTRPLAYLGGTSLPDLLRRIDAPSEPPAIVARWCRTLPPSACWRVLDWLWMHRVLVPA